MGAALTGRAGWWPSVVLGAGCLLNLSIQAQRAMPLAAPLDELPRELAGHTASDLAIAPEEARVAGASSSVHRLYVRDSSAFTVYVGYYDRQRQGKTIHSPKNCLPGGGWEPLESRRETLEGETSPIRVNRFVIANRNQQALVYYWYQGRGRTEANEYRVKLDLIRDSALRRRSEESLVRIVVPLAGTSATTADSLARAVARELHAALQRLLPE